MAVEHSLSQVQRGKLDELARAYDDGPVLAAVIGPVLLTSLAQGVDHLVSGLEVRGGWFGRSCPWLLLGLATSALLAVRADVRRQELSSVPTLFWLQGLLQQAWVLSLAWYSLPAFSVIAAFILCAAAFNDARYFHDSRRARWHAAAGWLVFLGLLLVVDVLGGPGLFARLREEPEFARAALVAALGLAVLQQFILAVVGAQWRRLDEQAESVARLQAEVAGMQREREVVARCCDFLVKGVTASRFSHDVASPISAAALAVSNVERAATVLSRTISDGSSAKFQQPLNILLDSAQLARVAVARVSELADAMARSLRAQGTVTPTQLPVLFAKAVDAAAITTGRDLDRGGTLAGNPLDCTVYVTSEHAAAIGTILSNAVAKSGAHPIQVGGGPVVDGYALLWIRDFGVPETERARALERIAASLALDDSASGAGQESESGYRVGLLLAKLAIVRHGGWLRAASPETGPGIRFEVLLPMVPPARAAALGTPERVLAAIDPGLVANPVAGRPSPSLAVTAQLP